MAQRFSINTPVRLQDVVFGPFVKAYGEMIAEHGAAYTVNFILAEHLRRRGMNVVAPETPGEKISRGQANRWKSARKDVVGDLAKAEARREAKRARDQRHRAKKRAERQAITTKKEKES